MRYPCRVAIRSGTSRAVRRDSVSQTSTRVRSHADIIDTEMVYNRLVSIYTDNLNM